MLPLTNYFLMKNASHFKLNVFLLVIGYVFLMMGNGLVPLTHPDEVFYAQTAKEMIAHDSWLTPRLFDQPQFEKPILFYWMTAVLMKGAGLNAFTARFWPAFFGVLGMLVVYWMAWMFFERKDVAFLSGLILGTSTLHISLSRAVLTDMMFSMWVILSLLSFYFAYRYQKYKFWGILSCFSFMGLAVLTKGLLGMCFPAGTIGIFLLLKKDLRFLAHKSVVIGFLIFWGIALPWHIFMTARYGDSFYQEYIHNVHVRRLFVSEHDKCNTWYFYLLTVVVGLFPWTFIFVPTARFLSKIRKKTEKEKQSFLFILSWVCGVLLFIQPAQSKLASYVFPAFPAFAILAAFCLTLFLEQTGEGESRGVKAVQLSMCVFGAVLAVVSVGAIFARAFYRSFVPHPLPVYVMALLFLSLAAGLFLSAYRKQFQRIPVLLPLFPLFLILSFLMFRPLAEPWISCRKIADIFNSIDQSDTTVVASKFYVRGIRFFTDRDVATIDVWGKGFFSPHPIPFLDTDKKAMDFFKQQPETYAIVKENDVSDIKRICQLSGCSVRYMGGLGGKYILKVQSGIPKKEVVD